MSESNNNQSTEIKLQDPDEEVKPRVSKDDIADLVDRLYGLKVHGPNFVKQSKLQIEG